MSLSRRTSACPSCSVCRSFLIGSCQLVAWCTEGTRLHRSCKDRLLKSVWDLYSILLLATSRYLSHESPPLTYRILTDGCPPCIEDKGALNSHHLGNQSLGFCLEIRSLTTLSWSSEVCCDFHRWSFLHCWKLFNIAYWDYIRVLISLSRTGPPFLIWISSKMSSHVYWGLCS